MGRSFVAIHCCYLASRMLGAPSPCRGVWFEEPSAVIPQARVCEGGGQPRYGDPKSGTKLETADTDKVTLPRCCILLYSEGRNLHGNSDGGSVLPYCYVVAPPKNSPPREEGARANQRFVRKRGRSGRSQVHVSLSDHPVCAASVAARHFLIAQPPLFTRSGIWLPTDFIGKAGTATSVRVTEVASVDS